MMRNFNIGFIKIDDAIRVIFRGGTKDSFICQFVGDVFGEAMLIHIVDIIGMNPNVFTRSCKLTKWIYRWKMDKL